MGTALQPESDPTLHGPCYVVHNSPNRGLGLYAARLIPSGTRILADDPLLIIPYARYMAHDVKAAYDKLSPQSQAKYMSLASCHGQSPSLWPSKIHPDVRSKEKQRISEQHDARTGTEKTLLSIMMTNAMPWGAKLEGSAVFQDACRCNHSCSPNACFTWNDAIGKETVHATKAIEAGEEILVPYIDPLYDDAVRRDELKHYGFVCECKACQDRVTEDQRADGGWTASKERRYRLREINDLLGRRQYWVSGTSVVVSDEGKRIQLRLEAICLLKAEELVSTDLGNLYGAHVMLKERQLVVLTKDVIRYFELAEACSSKSDYVFAAKAAKQGYRTIVTCVGDDAPLAEQKLAVLEKMLKRAEWVERVDSPSALLTKL